MKPETARAGTPRGRSAAHRPDDQGMAMDAQFWDEMHRGREQVFSRDPNGVLVAEITGMPPGQALDVGCGEGADGVWPARRGWKVTAGAALGFPRSPGLAMDRWTAP